MLFRSIDTEIRPDTEQAPAVNAPNNPPGPTNKETVPSDLTVEKSTDKAPIKPSQKAPKADKSAAKPKPPKAEKAAKPSKAADKKSPAKKEAPAPEQPPEPKDAPRKGEKEEIVHLNISELHPFKNHPFQVRNDDEMAAMVESVKDKGVTQPASIP